MNFFQEIVSIFFDENTENKIEVTPFSALRIYKKELWEVYFDEIIVGAKYSQIEKLLERYKYFSQEYLSNELTEYFLKIFHTVDTMSTDGEVMSINVDLLSKLDSENTAVTVVPMHWSRYFLRWFDHMEKIWKKFSKKTWFPFRKFLWTKFTKKQATLSRAERLKNRENIYFPKNQNRIPENIILLDDVVSTGATLNSCAKILKKMWVKNIVIIVLATNI